MCRLVFFINMYLYDMIIYPIFIYQSIYPSIIYLSLSVFPFIHLLNNNQHLSSDNLEMHRICLLFVCLFFFLSIYITIYLLHRLLGKICLYIQQFIYLSISSNKSIYLHGYKSIYFSKERFLRHPVLLSFSMYVICMSSKSVGLLRANAPQSTCLSIGLQRRLDSSKQLSPL